MNEVKKASPDHPIHDLIAKRWSPYLFTDRPVPVEDLRSLFEAASWAPSSYNEQPWRYLVATKLQNEEFHRMLSCLVDPNQAWAKAAPVLAIGCACQKFSRNDKPNNVAEHDLGIASATLTFEATARGLYVHQMAGILPDKARGLYNIPEDVKPVTALAIGYAADLDSPEANSADESLKERDAAPRSRKPLDEFVFEGQWGDASGLAD